MALFKQPSINLNMGKAQEVVDEIHTSIQPFAKRTSNSDNDSYLLGSYLISAVCKNHEAGPNECAEILKKVYRYDITPEQVIRNFHFIRIANPAERRGLLQWADLVSDFYAKALTGDREAFNKLEEQRRTSPLREIRHHFAQERIAAIMIYEKFPELDQYGDKELLFRLGNTMAKNYFYHMYDALCHVYNFPIFKLDKTETEKSGPRRTETRKIQAETSQKISYEQALRRIDELEIELKRTNEMFGELQDEFDNQLRESKIAELTGFFAHLNSDKYGNILDQLLQVRRGMDKLKKDGYELPLEINGLFIVIKQLIQFTRDSHIDPIMKVHSQKEVSYKDIEFCDYEGSPFIPDDARKIIEVVSPGWVYKDQNVQISRPRVKELKEEE